MTIPVTKNWRSILGELHALEAQLLDSGDNRGAEICEDARALIIRMYTMMDEARTRVSLAITSSCQKDAIAKLTRAKNDMTESKLTFD